MDAALIHPEVRPSPPPFLACRKRQPSPPSSRVVAHYHALFSRTCALAPWLCQTIFPHTAVAKKEGDEL
jgi:hypothetical protein